MAAKGSMKIKYDRFRYQRNLRNMELIFFVPSIRVFLTYALAAKASSLELYLETMAQPSGVAAHCVLLHQRGWASA